MSKGFYVGVEGLARRIKRAYIGVEGLARRVSAAYRGEAGLARQFFAGAGLSLAVNGVTYGAGDSIILSSAGTYTIDVIGSGTVDVTVIGAGGGGGGADNYSNTSKGGGGGGSGGMSAGTIALSEGQYQAIVGAGGPAGAVGSVAGDTSRDGGDSSFSGISAGGGRRGTYGAGSAGAGGAGGSGDTPGNPGHSGETAGFMAGALSENASRGGASLHPDGYGGGGSGWYVGSIFSGPTHQPTAGGDGALILRILG